MDERRTARDSGSSAGQVVVNQVVDQADQHAPTDDVTMTVDGDLKPYVGEDPASGAGTDSGLDWTETYTLSFTGAPHPQQGYHVKLTIHTPGSIGNDTKTKVFWVEGCVMDGEPSFSSSMVTKPCNPPAPAGMSQSCINQLGSPGVLIWHCGRSNWQGGLTYVGLIYMVNPTYLGGFFSDQRLIVAGLGGMMWMSIGVFIMSKMISFEI